MTVSYSRSLATFRYAALVRLLVRWRGSVYKAVWPAVTAFIAIYFVLALTYYLLPTNTLEEMLKKRTFVQVCAYVAHTSNAIPVSFVLGFFVNMVINRWQNQFYGLPTPDSVCLLMGTFLRKQPKTALKRVPDLQTDRPLLFRRTITRYLNLSCALCFYAISLSLRRHVATLDELVYCGLMTKQELEIYVKLCRENDYFFIPLVWAITLLTRAHHEGMIHHERHLDAMVTSVVTYWRTLQTLFLYDYVNVPLVYNQVVTLVVYVYMASLVISHQFSDPARMLNLMDMGLARASNTSLLIEQLGNTSNPSNETIADLEKQNLKFMADALNVTPTVPIFALLSLVFYMGWLRVAETNVFPFGEDDDDFEVIPLLERNLSAGVWFVDGALSTDSDILNLLNQQKLPEVFHMGPKGDAEEPGVSSALLAEAIKHEAMGWKRTPATYLAPPPTGPDIIVSPPGEETVIPELPCPDALRRRTSKYFFAGSMNRLQEQEEGQTRHASMSQATDGDSVSHTRSTTALGSFVGRVGRRISEALNPAPRIPLDPLTRRSSKSNWQYDDVEGPPKRD